MLDQEKAAKVQIKSHYIFKRSQNMNEILHHEFVSGMNALIALLC